MAKKFVLILAFLIAACSNTGGPIGQCPNTREFTCHVRAVKTFLVGNDLEKNWYEKDITVDAVSSADAEARVRASAVKDNRWTILSVACAPTTGQDAPLDGTEVATLTTAFGPPRVGPPRVEPLTSGGADCSMCTVAASQGQCLGPYSACMSDAGCSMCLTCLSNGGNTAACGCSDAITQGFAGCLAEACPVCAGPSTPPVDTCTDPDLSSLDDPSAACPGGPTCQCDSAGAFCVDGAPISCCSGGCSGGTCE